MLIVGRNGRLLADSAGAARGASYASRPEIAAALGGTVAQERRTSKTLNEEILATAVPVFAGNRVGGAVRVTQSIAAVHSAVRRTWVGLGIIGGIVLALGLVAGSIIARRVSRPILGLDRAARRVADGDLTARAEVEGSAEQQDLARTFNGMTERISLLLAAQREFVADASHQLRTPLAGLRLRLEEARAEATTVTQREDLDAGLSEVDRLAEIVTELLELSRAGEGGRPAATTEVGAAVTRLAERWTAPAHDAGCTLEVRTRRCCCGARRLPSRRRRPHPRRAGRERDRLRPCDDDPRRGRREHHPRARRRARAHGGRGADRLRSVPSRQRRAQRARGNRARPGDRA